MKHLYVLTVPKSPTAPVALSRVGSFETWRELNASAMALRANRETRDRVRVYDDTGALLRPRMSS